MNIITSVPRYSDGEINRAFMREIQNGFKLERETEQSRVQIAEKEAAQERGKTHPALGQCVATIPARDFFRMVNKYGHEEVHSEEFIKYYQKKYSSMAPNKI